MPDENKIPPKKERNCPYDKVCEECKFYRQVEVAKGNSALGIAKMEKEWMCVFDEMALYLRTLVVLNSRANFPQSPFNPPR